VEEDDSNPDASVFREAMRDVRRLSASDRADTGAPRPKPVPYQRWADERAVLRELLDPAEPDPLGAERGEALSYLREGYQRRILRRLRRGQYSIGAELDLHGMTVDVARRALTDFLAECHLRACTGARIIHGKGRRSRNDGPVLKGKVERWLRQRDDVIAYCSARSVDGGTGALYVLLRH